MSDETPDEMKITDTSPTLEERPPKRIDVDSLIKKILIGYGSNGTDDNKNIATKTITDYLIQVASEYPIYKDYNILIFYDTSVMIKRDADNIYNAITSFEDNKPLIMILYSNGGEVASAYLIGQLCRENSNNSFVITVPRQAKSAATLLCCAADEIHMGSLSELGPIDPQIDGLPALGLKNSVEHIAKLVKEIPESAEMFAKYLNLSLKPIDLGYYERVAESAMQYAERLLYSHAHNLTSQVDKIAYNLVYSYKDHGFVIDKNEASTIFGSNVIKINTQEYMLGNRMYLELSLIERVLKFCGYRMYLIGSLRTEPTITKK